MPKQSPAKISSQVAKATVLSIGRAGVLLTERNGHLRKAGFQVLSATSVADAIPLAQSKKPRVIIIGHRVPANDRVAIVDKIHQLDDSIKVILIYDETISKAEMADALLSARGEPRDLIQTVVYLLSKSDGAGVKRVKA